MRKAKYQNKSKKLMSTLIASVLIISTLIGGAFAWTDFTQSRTNKFRGSTDADVTLHDEFDGENKDVFVENSGTSEIYVRVRLDEYMQIGKDVFHNGAVEPDVKDKTSWIPHTYTGASINDCEQTDFGKFHSYYTWNMSGAERDYKPGTPGMVYQALGADGKVDMTGANHTAAATGIVKISYYLELAEKVDAGVPFIGDEQAIWDNIKVRGCWLVDDTDTAANGGAWAYWSLPLKPAVKDADGNIVTPGQATNLLLDEVKRTAKEPLEDWIYRIDVKLQAVTANEFGMWNDAASTIGYKTTDAAETLITVWKNAL